MAYGYHNMMNFGCVGPFIWVLFGLIIMIIYTVSQGFRPKEPKEEKETALDILKKRYAKGEINKEEFEKIKRDL